MSTTTVAELALGQDLALPLDAVTRTTGIVGQRGTGKTSTAVVMVEEAAAAGAHFAVIDPTGAWYGLRSSADGDGPGLECIIFGGWNGDLPLEAESGRLVATLVIEEGLSVVLDLEKLTKGQQVRFVAEFCEELYHRNRAALALVVDEAHRFAPQQLRDPGGFGARCLGALTDVVTLGRRKGLGAVLISQRPAKIAKDVFEQAEIMVAHRLMGPNDRKAIGGWLEESGEGSAADLAALPKLERGSAIVHAPAYGVGGIFAIREKRTFDSSATPEVGGQVVLPKGRADVNLGALEARMSETIERQREEDPKALRERVKDLEAKLAAGAPAADPAQADRIRDLEAQVSELEEQVRSLDFRGAFLSLAHDAGKLADYASSLSEEFGKRRDQTVAAPPGPRPPAPEPAPAPPDPGPTPDETKPLKAGARRMLWVLASYESVRPDGLTRQELSTLAMVAKGGTLSDYLSSLRGAGLIEEADGRVRPATGHTLDEFVAIAGAVKPLRPFKPDEIVAMHAPKLKAGARRMLDVLMRAPEQGFTRKELGGLANVAAGGTLSDYLSSLRSRGLIDERARRIYPAAVLYLGQERGR